MTVPKPFLPVASPGVLLRVRVRRMERDKVSGSRSGVLCRHWPPAEKKMGHVRVSAQGRVGQTGSDSEKRVEKGGGRM